MSDLSPVMGAKTDIVESCKAAYLGAWCAFGPPAISYPSNIRPLHRRVSRGRPSANLNRRRAGPNF
jgi:hypothetical protein